MGYLARRRRQWLGRVVGLAAGLDFLSNVSVNFAESAIRAGLGVSSEGFLWVLTAYAVAGALSIALLERLSRMMRLRDLLLIGIALFALGSFAAVLSESLPQLIAARLIQGLGGGPLMTCGRVLLQISLPPERRPRQLQGFMLAIFAAAAPGAWLAASLIESGNWHALFVLHTLAGVLVWLCAWAILPKGNYVARGMGHLDPWALLAFCLGVLLCLHELQGLRYQPLAGALTLRLAAGGALFLGLAWRLRRHPDPWFNLDTLASRRYLVGLAFYTWYYLLNGAITLVLPRYLLSGEGFDLLNAGRVLSLGGLATVLALPGYFRLARHLPDRRYVMAGGFVLFAGLCAYLSRAATGMTSLSLLLPVVLLKGLFPVLVVIQVAGLAFREFKHLDFAHAYAMKNVLRLLANAVGAGLADVYWQTTSAQSRTALVERIDVFSMGSALDSANLLRLSQDIDRQAALICASQTFAVAALLSLLGAVAVVWQKALR
jgi:MFS family permease